MTDSSMRSKVAVATILAILAYLALAVLISVAQTPSFMVGFFVCLFLITGAYVLAILSPHRPNKRRVVLGLSGVITMLVGYPVLWFYWGSGDGPFSPYDGLFGSRITLYCGPFPSGCIQINSWLIFAALIIASLMILWSIRPYAKKGRSDQSMAHQPRVNTGNNPPEQPSS